MGWLSEGPRRLLGDSLIGQPFQPLDSVAQELPAQHSQPEETPLLSANSAPMWEVAQRRPWQERGKSLQATDVAASGSTRPVYLGVDFGTALTKVAVRTGDFVFFIRWDELIGYEGYFLPGRLASTKNGGSVPGIGEFQALKEPFLPGHTPSEEDQVRAVEFLSAVMRFARAWLFANHPSLVQAYSLAWNLRIGCPTNLFEADDSKELYRRLAAAAWVASHTDYLTTGKEVRRILREGVEDLDAGLDDLKAVPEFVAQITSYSRSPQRNDGLHLLVDCGAGTVDVVSFNVLRPPKQFEDQYPIFSSDVRSKGTRFLMERYLGESTATRWDTDSPLPDHRELKNRFGVDQARLAQVESSFRADLGQVIRKVLLLTRNKRYPMAPEWEEGLPIFLCGGGSASHVYRDSVIEICQKVRVEPLLRGFPTPADLTQGDISPAQFHRLSVAYGLTFDSGRIYTADETKDATLPTAPVQPDRDDLYPK